MGEFVRSEPKGDSRDRMIPIGRGYTASQAPKVSVATRFAGRRTWLIQLLALGTMAASPPQPLPVPPIPPHQPPSDQAAPMPDFTAHAPVPMVSQGTQLSPYLFRYNNHDTSLGYTPGSRAQTSDDRRLNPAPGFTLRVPIQ